LILDSQNGRGKTGLDGTELPDSLSTASNSPEIVKHFSGDRELPGFSLYSKQFRETSITSEKRLESRFAERFFL
jgi:hypothetical protein